MIQRQKFYLTAEKIYQYLNSKDEKVENLIFCKPDDVHLITSDQALYEALGSFEDRSKIDLNRLVKLLEVVEVNSFTFLMKKERHILKPERAEQIRKT